MLTPDDYNHLKTLYEHFRKSNSYIRSLMEANDWDGIDAAIQEKNSLLKKIIFFEKPRINDIKENTELNKIRLELIELEKENLEIAKSMKEVLSKELNQVHNNNKIRNAYAPSSSESTSTLEISDFE